MSNANEGFQLLAQDAAQHVAAGRLDEAIAAYRAALTSVPGHPVVLHNLGVVLASQDRPEEAIACFDAALSAHPDYAAAHYNRGVALLHLGDVAAAIGALDRAARIDPDNYEAHRSLAFCWLAAGNRARAMDHFARTYELRRGESRIGLADRSLNCANRTKLRHDAAHFGYLSTLRGPPNRFTVMARNYATLAQSFPDEVTALSAADFDRIGQDYNCAIHLADSPEVPRAVNPREDREALTAALAPDGPGAVHFDDLLSDVALQALRRHLLESTIWHDFSHIDGYVASYLEDGLACPLLLQIADEIRATFPEVLADKPLSQAWSFKGVTPGALIDAHADDAAVSINFWLTPTAANRAADTGGLRICLEPPPADWVVGDYEADRLRAVQFLEQHRIRTMTVPYRINRAALFRSRLLHASDRPDFDEAFDMTRINVTMLFGQA